MCQEGVKEVSSRGLLADSLQEVVYDGLIGTEWVYHKHWMEHSLVLNGTLIGTEWSYHLHWMEHSLVQNGKTRKKQSQDDG